MRLPTEHGGEGMKGISEQGSDPSELFAMTERPEGGATVVALTGELDFATVAQVQQRLAELRDQCTSAVLDLDGLTFMDSTGIRLVLTACEDAERSSWSFYVTRGSERVQRVLEAAQVIDRLPYLDAAAG